MSEAKRPIKRKSQYDLTNHAILKVPKVLYDELVKDAEKENIHWSEKARQILEWHYTTIQKERVV